MPPDAADPGVADAPAAAVLSAAFKDALIAALGQTPDPATRQAFDEAFTRRAVEGFDAWLAAGGRFQPAMHIAYVPRPAPPLSHEVAWAQVFEGTVNERREALDHWAVVAPPDGVSDALAELYLAEATPDPGLRRSLGLYTGHRFSEEVGLRLAARFAADPDGERDLAGVAMCFDAHGPAWDALVRLVLKTDDAVALYRLFDAAYRGGRADDLFVCLRGRSAATLRALADALPPGFGARLQRATGHP